MKKILVPTDFSEISYYAAEVAAQIAKKHDARVYLMHILDMPDGYDVPKDMAEQIFVMKRTKMEFRKLVSQPFFKGVNLAEVLLFNQVSDSITEHAKEHEMDLIVMGSNGTKGHNAFSAGSNTQKVVRYSDVPVLTVKHRQENFDPKSIVFASNFFGEAEDSFTPIADFAQFFNAQLHLLKVITPSNFENTGYSNHVMEAFAQKQHLKNYTLNTYNHKNMETGILEFATSTNADVIAINTHGRRGISHLVAGSIAEDVVNEANACILSVKLPKVPTNDNILFPG
ncbi:MAG: universal stress protein UspA [Crocinitomicaceae bacterium]|nr:universal stress protein UspA [Crocinitomicaceae bacterium]|tara:strand:- start:5769 stop:6620 length:852 start_codon:yes stop_codon:yes gene_type:complete